MQRHYKCPWDVGPSLGGSTASWPLINMLIQGTATLDPQTQFPNYSELVPGWGQTQHIRIPCMKSGTWWRFTPMTGIRIQTLKTHHWAKEKEKWSIIQRETEMQMRIAPGGPLCPNSPSSRGQTAGLPAHGLLLFSSSLEFMRLPRSFLMHSFPL